MAQMTATDLPAADEGMAKRPWALPASMALSTMGIVFNVGAWMWADGQRINYDDVSLVNIEDSILSEACCTRTDYLGFYLVGMLVLGVVALGLALAGARSSRERPWLPVVVGAMAMFLIMVPVVFLVGHEINHWYAGVPVDGAVSGD